MCLIVFKLFSLGPGRAKHRGQSAGDEKLAEEGSNMRNAPGLEAKEKTVKKTQETTTKHLKL